MFKDVLRQAFNWLPTSIKYELFYQSARSLGVESYGVAGHAGTFAGPAWDVTIIKSYLYGTVWPQPEIDTIAAFFNRHVQGTFYDIGANIGMVTVPIVRMGVNVVAFEPDDLNRSLLRANLARNCPDANVTIDPRAVWRETTSLRFAKSTYNSGDHHIHEDGEIEVPAIALDDLPAPTGPLAIKIDAQGAEPSIFAGGERTIKSAGMVLSEFWPFGMSRMGLTPDAVLDAAREFPHGKMIESGETPWMTGGELTDRLFKLSRNVDRQNEVDFLLAQERF